MSRDRGWIAALPLGLVAALLFISQISPKSSKPVNLLERYGDLRRAQQLVAMNRARVIFLADDEAAADGDAAPKPCVSWRGCSQYYNPEFVNVSAKSFYDRFDRQA
jgi:hypothetical protein